MCVHCVLLHIFMQFPVPSDSFRDFSKRILGSVSSGSKNGVMASIMKFKHGVNEAVIIFKM